MLILLALAFTGCDADYAPDAFRANDAYMVPVDDLEEQPPAALEIVAYRSGEPVGVLTLPVNTADIIEIPADQMEPLIESVRRPVVVEESALVCGASVLAAVGSCTPALSGDAIVYLCPAGLIFALCGCRDVIKKYFNFDFTVCDSPGVGEHPGSVRVGEAQ